MTMTPPPETGRQESRHKLLEAAARVYCACGFRGSTTRRIAEEAGVNEVTLFRHFGSKAQLLCEALSTLDPMAHVHLPAEPGDAQEELTAWCAGHLAAMRELRALVLKTMAEMQEFPEMRPHVSEQQKPQYSELVAYTTKLRAPRTRADRTEVETACSMLFGALFADALAREVAPAVFPVAPEHAAAAYVRLFLQSLGLADRAETRGVTRVARRKQAV